MHFAKKVLLVAAAALAGLTAHADEERGRFTVGLGADYSTGKYGGTQSTDVAYYSAFGRYEVGRWTARLTLPWLRITGQGTVVGGDRPIVLDSTGQASRISVSGMGDMVAGLTYTAYESSALVLDVTGKVKLPTASEADGLGTGRTDYIAQTDAYYTMRPGLTAFAGLGFRHFGDPAGADFRDVFSGNSGLSWKALPKMTIGASFDYRQPVIANRDAMRELTPFLVWKFTDTTKVQLYAVKGYSKSSVDWGGGAVLMQSF
jgi:hypothetical protein